MFEIGVISIVVLAVGYWVTLWLMGRHDDVLHGDFVHAEREGEAIVVLSDSTHSLPVKPPFPPKPRLKPAIIKPLSEEAIDAKPLAANTARAEAFTTESPMPALAVPSDTLQSLLASIKRDLKDASQL